MQRLACLLLCGLAAFAQTETPPEDYKVAESDAPPAVVSALRARITQFYQAHVDGKFRIADKVVAEDSQDTFFAMAKRQYQGFEITVVRFTEDLKKAQAVVTCAGEWNFRGSLSKVKMPQTSTWKIEDGQWFWYVIQIHEVKTPFGTMHFDKNGAPVTGPATAPVIPDPQRAAQAILTSVQIDKKAIQLSSYEPSSTEIHIKNGMAGHIRLRVAFDSSFQGLSYQLDRDDIPAGETAVLKIVCEPKDRVAKPSVTMRIWVDPTNQSFAIPVTFAIPPEVESQLPKELRPPKPDR